MAGRVIIFQSGVVPDLLGGGEEREVILCYYIIMQYHLNLSNKTGKLYLPTPGMLVSRYTLLIFEPKPIPATLYLCVVGYYFKSRL